VCPPENKFNNHHHLLPLFLAKLAWALYTLTGKLVFPWESGLSVTLGRVLNLDNAHLAQMFLLKNEDNSEKHV
jgi:hypothetical protein